VEIGCDGANRGCNVIVKGVDQGNQVSNWATNVANNSGEDLPQTEESPISTQAVYFVA
jgi:hypothetical protein